MARAVGMALLIGCLITGSPASQVSAASPTAWHIDHTVVYKVDAEGGDSGGPVYVTTLPYPYTRYKATLWGTHVHSEDGAWSPDKLGWYSPIDRGINTLENKYPGVSLSPCVTATCGLPDPVD